MAQDSKLYRRGSSVFRVRTPSLSEKGEDLEESFLTFLEHPEHYHEMRAFLKHFPQYIHDFDFVCKVSEFSQEKDPTKRYKLCKTILPAYVSGGFNNKRKRPKYNISVSPQLLDSVADEVWDYRGGKYDIPSYIFDEPFDVVSGLLARRVFGLFNDEKRKQGLLRKENAARHTSSQLAIARRESQGWGSYKTSKANTQAAISRSRKPFGVSTAVGIMCSIKNKFNGTGTKEDEGYTVEAQNQPGIYKQGWLYKKGGNRKNWKNRWFVLIRDALLYYDAPESTRPLGIILLTCMKVTHAPKAMTSKYHGAFQIFDPEAPSERIYYLRCLNTMAGSEEKKWIKAISTGIIRASAERSSADFTVENAQKRKESWSDPDSDDEAAVIEEEMNELSERMARLREKRQLRAQSSSLATFGDSDEGASDKNEEKERTRTLAEFRAERRQRSREKRRLRRSKDLDEINAKDHGSKHDLDRIKESSDEDKGIEGEEDLKKEEENATSGWLAEKRRSARKRRSMSYCGSSEDGEIEGQLMHEDASEPLIGEHASLRSILRNMKEQKTSQRMQEGGCKALRVKATEAVTDGDEISRRERKLWKDALTCMKRCVFDYPKHTTIQVSVAVCLSKLVLLDVDLRDSVIADLEIMKQVKGASSVLTNGDAKRAHRRAMLQIRQAELASPSNAKDGRPRRRSSSNVKRRGSDVPVVGHPTRRRGSSIFEDHL